MRKREIIATPPVAVGLALRSFAASVVKEEERRKKRLLSSTSGKRKDRGAIDVADYGSGAEGSSNRTETRKRPFSNRGNDSNETFGLPSWVDPATSSPNSNETGEDNVAEPFQDWSLPTDTLVALKMMCQQFPKIDQTAVRPFVLKSQLYSSVSNRTLADQQLEELKQQHVVRIFKLNSGKDDFGIMFKEDYLDQIEAEKKRMSTKRAEEDICIFDWFMTSVVTAYIGVSIRHPDLVLLLSKAGKVNDKQISLLINAGLLVRQIADDMTYWFGIPNIGSLLKSLSAGRKELQSFLSRRRYKEMLQAILEKKTLRTSQLNMRFHIRDLLGSGQLSSVHTPVGPLLRLARI